MNIKFLFSKAPHSRIMLMGIISTRRINGSCAVRSEQKKNDSFDVGVRYKGMLYFVKKNKNKKGEREKLTW